MIPSARRALIFEFDVEARASDVAMERGRVFVAFVGRGKFDA